MSNYNGRRGPNVSQYIADLNTLPAQQEPAPQAQAIGVDDDFSLFTNTEFFDFDMGSISDVSHQVDYDPVQEERARRQNASAYRYSSIKPEPLNGDFQFGGFSSFAPVMGDPSATNLQQPQYSLPQQTSPIASSPTSPLAPTNSQHHDVSGDHSNGPVPTEDAARVAAEEDKRRRNTAASARFRVKKKQREQALEKQAREMTERSAALEARVSQLEMENKWLKSLITEKHGGKGELGDMYKKFGKDAGLDSRSTSERNDGVGTGKADSGEAKE